MTLAAVTLTDLRRIDLFDDLSDDELAEWVAVTREWNAAPGEVLAEQGQEPPGLMLLLDGAAQAALLHGDRPEPVAPQRAPTWMGAIHVLLGEPTPVRLYTETSARLALVERSDFRRLVFAHPAVHDRVLREVAPVIGRISGIEHERERLASLGTMAAGLAHELNNPAAAAQRAAADMAEALDVLSSALQRFVESGVERAEAHELVRLQQDALARAAGATALEALDAADAEDELLEVLEELGVEEPWRLSEPLAAAGLDRAWVERVAALAGPATTTVLRWVAASLTAGRLAAEIQESAGRMSELVRAVKSYAYMDRGAVVEVDLHEGLETTLTVLGHKLKHTAIEVVRDYDRELGSLTVRGSELNQVWTNLLDNAIDALGDRGTITITTRADGACAVVEVADDGPGIPPATLERIFDPFFTTKEAGRGTGLGLATARRIASDRHGGSLTVESEPGRTVFRVRIPFVAP